jgi:hypothetical protein
MLSRKAATDIFLRENPTYVIVDSENRRESSEIMYDRFRYRKPGDERLYEQTWRWERGDSVWHLDDRGIERKVE